MTRSKPIRLGAFTLVSVIATLIAVDFGLGWIYVSALTNPGCITPNQLDGIPPPLEHWLATEDGLSLRAWYYPPKNGAAVLALGGISGSLGESLPPVRSLIESGYGVLQIDSRTCAHPSARVTLGADEVKDVAAGLDFLLSQPEVNPDDVGAFGFSMGGVAAIRAAAQHPQINAVIAEGGYDQLGRHIIQPDAEHTLLRRIFLYSVAGIFLLQTGINPWEVSPLEDIGKISPRAVFLIYGEYEIDRGGGREQFEGALEPKSLWVVPQANHGENSLIATEEYARRVVKFFDVSLLSK